MTPQLLINQCRLSGVLVHMEGTLLKLKGPSKAVESAANQLRPHKAAVLKYLLISRLEQFLFEQVKQEISKNYSTDQVHRINNMAWEFIQVDRMPPNQAFKVATEVVVNRKAAKCETEYIDVMKLWMELTGKLEAT